MNFKVILALLGMNLIQPREATSAPESSGPPRDECVILLHGLGRTAFSMKFIEWGLERTGYHVINLSYPSRRFSVETLSEQYLKPVIKKHASNGFRKIHFVTHSLGGIVLRQYLACHQLQNLGRVVMLAPPNHGSELADKLRRNPLGRWILGPAGCELGTGTNDAPARIPEIKTAFGVIAGDQSFNPLFSRWLPGPDDGKVSVQSTKSSSMADFLVLNSSHTWLMWRRKTVHQILSFLANGQFNRLKGARYSPGASAETIGQ